jgi:NTP pyrophosphatase (non-canonical NTP hydrolase)
MAKPCFHADVEAKHGLNKACDETICPTKQEQPLKSIAQWQREIHENAIIHGWWSGKRDIPELMALLHSEVSEAFEAYRDHDMELFREELADVAIRLMDTAQAFGIDLEKEIMRKAAINRTRPYRHGGKAC